MVAVPLQIQVSVRGLSVYCCTDTATMHMDDQDIQEGHGAIWSGVFSSELNTLVYGIKMLQKVDLYADLMTTKVSSTYLFPREEAGLLY